MRIVMLQDISQWTDSIEEWEYLHIPDIIDLIREEKMWSALGGNSLSDFVSHLMAKGAVKLSVETYTIGFT